MNGNICHICMRKANKQNVRDDYSIEICEWKKGSSLMMKVRSLWKTLETTGLCHIKDSNIVQAFLSKCKLNYEEMDMGVERI